MSLLPALSHQLLPMETWLKAALVLWHGLFKVLHNLEFKFPPMILHHFYNRFLVRIVDLIYIAVRPIVVSSFYKHRTRPWIIIQASSSVPNSQTDGQVQEYNKIWIFVIILISGLAIHKPPYEFLTNIIWVGEPYRTGDPEFVSQSSKV
jgi:hypothetical protein